MSDKQFDGSAVIRETLEEAIREVDKYIASLQEQLDAIRSQDDYIVDEYEERFRTVQALSESVKDIESFMEHSGEPYYDENHRLASGAMLGLSHEPRGGSPQATQVIRDKMRTILNEMESMLVVYRRQAPSVRDYTARISHLEYEKGRLEAKVKEHTSRGDVDVSGLARIAKIQSRY